MHAAYSLYTSSGILGILSFPEFTLHDVQFIDSVQYLSRNLGVEINPISRFPRRAYEKLHRKFLVSETLRRDIDPTEDSHRAVWSRYFWRNVNRGDNNSR